jgi:hypothetical protein
MGFFDRLVNIWPSDNVMIQLDRLVTILMYASVLMTLILVRFVGGEQIAFFGNDTTALYLLILMGVTIPFQFLSPKNNGQLNFGKSDKAALAIIVALFLGIMFFSSTNLSISTPLDASNAVVTSSSNVNSIVTKSISVYLSSFATPFIEEKFFALTLPIMLIGFFKFGFGKNYAIPLILTCCTIFAGFHVFAYNAQGAFIAFAFIFRFIVMIGNGYFESGLFGIGLHGMNNLANGIKVLKTLG